MRTAGILTQRSCRHVRSRTMQMPLDGFAHEYPQFLLVHSKSTRSTMPTIAASTGAAVFPIASPAARPSSTISTFSSTPAPTPSTASNSAPRGVSSSVSGWTSSSFAPSSFRCFCVETTVPVTLASSIRCSLADGPMVDDPNYPGIRRHFHGKKWETRLFAANHEHVFADAGTGCICGDERSPHRLVRGRHRLHEQQLDAVEGVVLCIEDDGADHAGELHYLIRYFHGINNTDDRGVNRTILHSGSHPGRAPAHYQHGFAKTGVDRVNGDEVAALRFALWIHRTGDQQLAADQSWVFSGRHDGADHLGQNHRISRWSSVVGRRSLVVSEP